MRRGDDSGVGWLIREGHFSRGGRKGESGEMKWWNGAAQALINPYQPLRFTVDMRPGTRVSFPFPPCPPRVFSIPPFPSLVVSFTPTEIIVIGVARCLHGLTRARCNLRCDASSSGFVPLSLTILIDRRTSAFLVSKIVTSTSSISSV